MASIANAFALLSAGDDATDVDVQALAAAAPAAKPAAPAPAVTEEKGERTTPEPGEPHDVAGVPHEAQEAPIAAPCRAEHHPQPPPGLNARPKGAWLTDAADVRPPGAADRPAAAGA